MSLVPSQTDTYNTALDIFDKTHPLRVDADENLKVAAIQSGTWTVNLATEPTIDIGIVDQGLGGASPWLINVNNFPATQPVSGTVAATQGTSPWVVSGSGNFTIVQPTGTNLHVVVDSGTLTTNQGIPNSTANKWPVEIVDSAGINVATVIPTTDSTNTSITTALVTQTNFAKNQTDLFGRQRVGSPQSIFSSVFLYDKQPLLWDESTATGGTSTFNANHASIDLAVTTSNGSRVIRQTKEYLVYEPGRAQLGEFTGVFGTGTTNCRQMIGLFDNNDGCFFELNGTTFGVTIRSSVSGSAVDTTITQASFNIDKLDGSGLSGMTIDLTKTQIFVVEYQWFGVGTVRFGVFFNNSVVYCHQVFHANLGTTVYMKRGSLPVRYEIVNSGTLSGAVTLSQICCTVFSEAGYSPQGINFSTDTGTTARVVAGTGSLPLLSIRLKAATNRATIVPGDLSVLTDAANNFRVRVILNGTLTGAVFNSVDTNSTAEFDVAATALTGGTILHSSYISSTGREVTIPVASLLKLVANIAGTADILTLYVSNITAGVNYYGALEWQEFV